MCGLCGIVGPAAEQATIAEMTDRLVHRGPDSGGLFCDEGIALGHRRLSILDLSEAGHQPMSLGTLTIVYNGEIYNFRELRDELPGPFRSDSDTEVLLHLYRDEGPSCVERLEGMFAFAIWDAQTRSLFAARDPLGIKPFHYRRLGGRGLAFASEIKGLLPLGRPSVDPVAMRDFFTYKYVPTPSSIYQEISKLPPGHTLHFCDGEMTIKRYWQAVSTTERNQPDEAQEELEELLQRVVNAHTLSDVPVGVFLSGGIDSSTVTACLDAPRTFNLGFDVRSHDESAVARRVASQLGAHHQTLQADGFDLESALARFVRIYDEPFGDHGAWAMFLIAERARQEVTVALTGEGGDELFAGYHWYHKHPAQRPDLRHRLAVALLSPLSATSRSAQRHLANGLERYSMFLGPFAPMQKAALLHPALTTSDHDDLWFFRAAWREDLEPLKRLQWADVHTYLTDDMLPKVDRATMAVSLEARPPLVDKRIVEFALSLAPAVLRSGERGKLPLRRFLARHIDSSAFERPKIGFSMPVRRWLRQQPALFQGACQRLARAEILAQRRHYRVHTNEQAWCLLVLDRWMQENDQYRGL